MIVSIFYGFITRITMKKQSEAGIVTSPAGTRIFPFFNDVGNSQDPHYHDQVNIFYHESCRPCHHVDKNIHGRSGRWG